MEEMINMGIVEKIRNEEGNLRYDYAIPIDDDNSVILIDSWENQDALDIHHASDMMETISSLWEKYDLHMKVERYEEVENDEDKKFIRE